MRPELECCRRCGYDLRDHPSDYILCPECGAPNNRETARRNFSNQPKPAAVWTLACLAGCVAYVPLALLIPVVLGTVKSAFGELIGTAVTLAVAAVLVGAVVFALVWDGQGPGLRTVKRAWLIVSASLGAGAAITLLLTGVAGVALRLLMR
ncbi:MAG TPA: hypothetical protein VFF65_02235 [Phycisphaerales bacterium]|nr:hypothetical protein [Phycisphaerales bacterium]